MRPEKWERLERRGIKTHVSKVPYRNECSRTKFSKEEYETVRIKINKQIKKYNLKNLNTEMKDIFEITAKEKYDLVISTGVIHHTKDPKLALKTLSSATKKDGALIIMVYAKYFNLTKC